MKLTVSGVYAIRNKHTGAQYIGSARKINVRRNAHYYLLRRGRHHAPHLQHSWDKHGESAFEVVVLEACEAKDLAAREQWWIDNAPCEYNVSQVAVSAALDPGVRKKIARASVRKGERFLVRGELLGVSAIRRRYGVIHSVFYARLERGWDVERAATEPPEKLRTVAGARVHEYRGKLHTLQELVPLASCSKTALFRRIKSGMSVAEAVEMTPEEAEALRLQKSVETRRARRCA